AGRQHGTGGLRSHHLAIAVFLEAVGQHFLGAARSTVDDEHDGLAPARSYGLRAGALRERHAEPAIVEDVEIIGLAATPAVAQVPDEAVGVLELSGDKLFEEALIVPAGIGPHMHIGELAAILLDDPRPVFHRAKVGVGWAQRLRRDLDRYG